MFLSGDLHFALSFLCAAFFSLGSLSAVLPSLLVTFFVHTLCHSRPEQSTCTREHNIQPRAIRHKDTCRGHSSDCLLTSMRAESFSAVLLRGHEDAPACGLIKRSPGSSVFPDSTSVSADMDMSFVIRCVGNFGYPGLPVLCSSCSSPHFFNVACLLTSIVPEA